MPYFKMPLSGDVSQAINPWSWFANSVGGQLGLVNINLGRSADPELEAQILGEVGSYGRQIGRLSDVVAILLAHVKTADLDEDERRQVDDFKRQLAEVETLKKRR